jgi:F0F1-type ATP synthase membrane subunit b/b'
MNIFIDFSVKMWYIYCYIGQSTIINRKQSFILRKGETMAKDILDAIRAAEEECGEREAQAKADAQERAAQAKKDAAALIDKREQAAREKCEKSLEQARAEAEKALEEARASAGSQCADISATAEKNRGRVVRDAAEAILR